MKDWRAVNGLFLTTTILQGIAFGHLNAFTPLYLADLGLSAAEVSAWTGFLYGAMMAVAFPLAPFWGALAERFSRRMVVMRCQYIEAVSYVIVAFAPDVWWVLAARLLLGLTFGGVAVVIATQSMLTPRNRIGTAIATIQGAAPIAATLGPPLGAGLIDAIGLRGLFLLDAGIALLAGLLITFLMPEPPRAERKRSVMGRTGEALLLVWRRPAIRWNFICWFLSIGSRAVVEVYLPVRIAELTPDPAPAIGLILGVGGLLTAVATFGSAKLVDDQGGIRWFPPSMLVAAVATLGIAYLPDLWAIAALAWVRAFPFAFGSTLLYAHLTRVLSPADQTVVLALTPTPRNSAMFVMPSLAALVAPLGVSVALAVGAAAYAGSALTGWLAQRTTGPEIARLGQPAAE